MNLAYFDCFSGAAGDMILGSLLDAGLDADHLRTELAKLDLDDVEIHIERVVKKGIAATSFKPIIAGQSEGPSATGPQHDHHHHNHEHGHGHSHPHEHKREHSHEAPSHHAPADHHHHHGHNRSLGEIRKIIQAAPLSPTVVERALAIFDRLGQAEAHVHGKTVNEVHFHEVGAADAICDIVGACIALEALQIERVVCSPLVVGSGTIQCAHGLLPVPAPATAELLRGYPVRATDAAGELLTPTGAAILTTIADEFGPPPNMTLDAVGYGAGQRDLPGQANVLRVMIGAATTQDTADVDSVCALQANLDDTTGEMIGHAMETLLAAGALDVYLTPIQMKKNRPGCMLTVLAALNDADRLEEMILRETTTFGVRRSVHARRILERSHQTIETPYGPVRIKIGRLGSETVTTAPEFEDCRRAAKTHHVPLKTVINTALKARDETT